MVASDFYSKYLLEVFNGFFLKQRRSNVLNFKTNNIKFEKCQRKREMVLQIQLEWDVYISNSHETKYLTSIIKFIYIKLA